MNVEVSLINHSGFKWISNDYMHFKGFLFNKTGNYYSGRSLHHFFSDATPENICDLLRSANGSFSFVIILGTKILFGTDSLRSIPLFYQLTGKGLLILDSPSLQPEKLEIDTIEQTALDEFYLTGYTCNKKTLLKNLYQVEPGTYIEFDKISEEINIKRYYRHTRTSDMEMPEEILLKRLDSINDNVFRRLIRSCEGRPIILPLSGGYDSRYIAVMLKRLGYQKVICYTYGKQNSFEVQISEKVASKLGYDWFFVEYNKRTWNDVLGAVFEQYVHFSHNFSSLPHIQEFFALDDLRKRNLLPEDGIVIPGFCGDLLGGSFLVSDLEFEKFPVTRESLIRYIYFKHFNLIVNKKKHIINESHVQERIREFIKDHTIESADDFISCNEDWFTQHKVSKYILNSLRVYEFFGLEWRLPFWDTELIEFWYRVPNHFRRDSYLYQKHLFRTFGSFDVAFLKPFYYKNSLLKKVYKKLFGQLTIINFLLYNRNDVNSFRILYDKLKSQLKRSKPESLYKNTLINHVLTLWVIEKFILKHFK